MLRVRDDGAGSSEWSMVSLQLPRLLCLGVDDVDELCLKRGSAYQETVDILLGGELFAGTTSYRP